MKLNRIIFFGLAASVEILLGILIVWIMTMPPEIAQKTGLYIWFLGTGFVSLPLIMYQVWRSNATR